MTRAFVRCLQSTLTEWPKRSQSMACDWYGDQDRRIVLLPTSCYYSFFVLISNEELPVRYIGRRLINQSRKDHVQHGVFEFQPLRRVWGVYIRRPLLRCTWANMNPFSFWSVYVNRGLLCAERPLRDLNNGFP